jgi:hypothetical protein
LVAIGFKIINSARIEGGGCIEIPRRGDNAVQINYLKTYSKTSVIFDTGDVSSENQGEKQ